MEMFIMYILGPGYSQLLVHTEACGKVPLGVRDQCPFWNPLVYLRHSAPAQLVHVVCKHPAEKAGSGAFLNAVLRTQTDARI